MSHEWTAWLNAEFLRNSVQDYLMAGVTFAVVLAAGYLVRGMALRRLKALAARTATDFDDFVVDLLGQIRHLELFIVSSFIASRGLRLDKGFDKAFRVVLVVLLTYRIVRLLQSSFAYGVRKYLAWETHQDPSSQALGQTVLWLVNMALGVCGAIFVLDNLGISVTAVMAGLGIGGVAVALAAQTVLKDLFSSLCIIMDRPFKPGDFIVVGEHKGIVERVGIKTTRIRSISGEVLVFSNSTLTDSPIRNFGLMQERRIVFNFGLSGQTPLEKIRRVPGIVETALRKLPKVRFDRAHLSGFGPASMDFEVVYFVLTDDYNFYMDCQHNFNLAILEALAGEGIELSIPVRKVFLTPAAA